jgi:MFS family permease
MAQEITRSTSQTESLPSISRDGVPHRKRAAASGLCGMATSLRQIILFRVIQGLAGDGLQPSSQGVLLDAFPAEKQGAAHIMFGIAALLPPAERP